MKLPKIVLACSLFLAWGANCLSASPPAVEKAEAPVAPAEATATPLVPSPAEAAALQGPLAPTCADGIFSSTFAGPGVIRCGSCSPSPCSGALLNARCGVVTQPIKRCLDTGVDCPDGLPFCQCSTGPV